MNPEYEKVDANDEEADTHHVDDIISLNELGDTSTAEVSVDELRELLEKTSSVNRRNTGTALSRLAAPSKEGSGRSSRIDSQNLKELAEAKRLEKVFNQELEKKETNLELFKKRLHKGKIKNKKSDRVKKQARWFVSAMSVPFLFALATVSLVFGFMCQIQSQFCATKAVRLIAKGEHDKAHRLLRKSLVWNPYNSSASREAGKINEKNKNDIAAFTHFSNAVKVEPNRIDFLDHKGSLAIKLKYYDVAVETYTHLLKVAGNERKKLHYYGNRALAYMQLKKYDKAIDDLTTALKMKRNDENSLMGRASCHNALNEKKEAIADLDRLLAVNPEHYEAHIFRGWVRQSATQYKEAQADYEAAIAIKPKNEKGYIFMAGNFAAAGNVPLALVQLDKALAINPRSTQAHAEKGRLLLASGQHKEALQQFKSADNLKVEENFYSLSERAKASLGAGEHQVAIKCYSKAIALKPDVYLLYYERAQALYAVGEYKRAIKDLDEAVKLFPNFTDAIIKRAECNIKLGNHVTAIADFHNAIKSNPYSAKPHIAFGKFNLNQKQFVTAKENFDNAIKLDPKDKSAKDLALIANQSLKKLVGSKPLNIDVNALPAKDLAEINSADIKTLLDKGYQAMQAGRLNYAETALERAVRLDPGSVLARRYLTTVFMVGGKAALAESQIAVLNQMGSRQDRDDYNMAGAFRKAGNSKRCIEYLDRHIASHPNDAKAIIELSEAHSSIGDIAKATTICFDAMNKFPRYSKFKERYLSLKESQARAEQKSTTPTGTNKINAGDSQG